MACPSAAKLRQKSGPSAALNVVGSQASIATMGDRADRFVGMPADGPPLLRPSVPPNVHSAVLAFGGR
jgi:hypothetical protein